VGINLLGYTEKEVGRLTLRKYNELFEWHKFFYNMQQKHQIYSEMDMENDEDEEESQIVLF